MSLNNNSNQLKNQLLMFGFSPLEVERGIELTGSTNLNVIASFIYDHRSELSASVAPAPDESVKMVLVVRKDLKLSCGKLASQCCHAAVGLYQRCLERSKELLNAWRLNGEKKIVLSIDNAEALMTLEKQSNLHSDQIVSYLVADAGLTQIESGTLTVLGLIGPTCVVDLITGKLCLF
mmetsp:Transcript_16517/g.24649  ORF Transcript_16517/g.24649 Transcript_16517/m.24649 type:complete len:178 (+) Transcript_16517:29-562(+)